MKMKKKIMTTGCLLLATLAVTAQVNENDEAVAKLQQDVTLLKESLEKTQALKISGYVQSQFQYGQEAASLKVGAANEGDKDFSRLGIRRGRLKLSYTQGIATGVLQFDLTEKGMGIKDAYITVKEPFTGWFALQGGLFNRPFGHEIAYSSSKRESPERSTAIQTLFPDERDLGAMLVVQAPSTSPLNFLKLEAGLFAGNGIKTETDSRKDFIGHLSATRQLNDDMRLGGGFSYYNGGVYQGTSKVYTMSGSEFVVDDNAANIGEYAKREYFGIDAQFQWLHDFGQTQIRGEYLWGTQPGGATSSKSPNSSTLVAQDTYVRPCAGGYILLVQDLGHLPLSASFKYDFYDPNTDLKGNEVGLGGSSKADVAYHTLGMGLIWRATQALRFTAWYEKVKNETSDNLAGYTGDKKDDVLTLRMQYSF